MTGCSTALIMMIPLSAALSTAGCGSKKDSLALAELAPSYVTIAESATSLLAEQLGNFSAPPSPGALAGQGCASARCGDDAALSNGAGPTFLKQALGCSTKYGSLSGSVSIKVSAMPEYLGCATRSGPLSFRRWPPSRGRVALAIGPQSLLASGVPSAAPSNTLDRTELGRAVTHNWGVATLDFDGTSDAIVSFDHRVTIDNGAASANGNVFHLRARRSITMHIPEIWDSAPRRFTGSFDMTDESRGLNCELHLDNLVYKKNECCHPVSGTLSLVADSASDPGGAASSFTLEFSSLCGHATLHDQLGRASSLRLPDCSG